MCGRCIPEILRAIQALQVVDTNDVATPANWTPCGPGIVPSSTTFDGLWERNESIQLPILY